MEKNIQEPFVLRVLPFANCIEAIEPTVLRLTYNELQTPETTAKPANYELKHTVLITYITQR